MRLPTLSFHRRGLCAASAAIVPVLSLLLASCGPRTVGWEDLNVRNVTLPNGKKVTAEVVTDPVDMTRGMMFRDSLAENRGMLFIHGSPGRYTYWMYQVKIPLDILWLDRNGRILEIAASAQPCQTQASKCPHYGGNAEALYVLELAGGVAAKHGLKTGDMLRIE